MHTTTSPRRLGTTAVAAATSAAHTAAPFAAFAMPAPNPKPESLDEIVKEVAQTFDAFKEKNEAALKGKADATELQAINDNVTKIAERLDAAQKALGRLTVGGAAPGGGEIEQQATQFYAAAGRRPRAGEQPDVEAYRAYCEAFPELLRQGLNVRRLTPELQQSLSIGSDRDGGYLVPAERSMEMERRIYETSPMRQVARVITIGGPAWEAPFKASKGVSGGWVGERQSRPATGTGTVGMQRIEVHEQYAYPEVTQNMLDDGTIDVEAFVTEDTEDEMARTENLAFVSGDGVMKPRGFLHYKDDAVTTDDATRNWGVLQYVPSGAAGGFPKISGSVADDASALIDLMAKLNPIYRAGSAWAMNRSTEATVRKLRDADGRYLVEFGRLADDAFGFTVHGYPIVNMEDMPDVGSDSFSIAYGNWRRGYYVVDRLGFRVLIDPYTNKPYVGFYITKRTGGDIRNFDAIKLMKFATS